jgi:hypothetical protein
MHFTLAMQTTKCIADFHVGTMEMDLQAARLTLPNKITVG